MKKKQYITFFLLFISMVMLMVPVTPHHHHADGLICMKNDITPDCCEQHHSPDNEHCCCDTGCVTTYVFHETPGSNSASAHLSASWVLILYIDPLFKLPILPESNVKRQDCIYSEALHATFITRATGLRAPPLVLA